MCCLISMCLFLTVFFLQLIPILIALWLEKMLDTISVFLNLLRLDLWPKMWSILENVSCVLKNKMYSSVFAWNSLKILIRSTWFNVSLKAYVSLLLFSFDDLSICVSGALKSPTIIVLLSISPFMSVSIALYIEMLLCWVHKYLKL